MKKLWKKLLAITTAVMMVVTLLPAMARASTASENAVIKDNFDLSQKGSITNLKKEALLFIKHLRMRMNH